MQGASPQRDVVELAIDRAYITFVNLFVLKDKMGYSVRDFIYYKKRCATDVASLQEIDYEHQARAMLRDNESERKVRVIMAKESLKDLSVSITPIKRTREQQQEDLPCAQEEIDAYKVWLSKLKEENPRTELKDEFRQQTIETYKEWLTLQGDLLGDDITNDGGTSTENGENDSSQARKNWPSHARRPNKAGNGQCTGGQKKGRGPLKGHSVAFKRIKSGCQKLPIQFSSRLGGPQGENYRSFVDEVVMFTRKRAPLIGVRSWKDISSDVKNAIVTDLKNRWDFGNTRDVDGKILGLARSRYAGWRSTLSATYRAYESDAERAKNKPEDVDIVEWHYLMKYFATEKIPAKRTQLAEANNRSSMGVAPSLSLNIAMRRNPETGEEPNDIELWMITHSKNGKWSNNAAHDVYRLREELADQTAQTDRKVEEATQKIQEEEEIKREEMRKQIKEDMAAFFAKQTQGLALQTNTPSSTLTVCAARMMQIEWSHGQVFELIHIILSW
ncbi:hypothetical protein U9M48_031320 [Paspalum notatum var. saurae]